MDEKYRYNSSGNEKPVKLISIVFTNNSLLEGKAWKSRTSAKFENQNILVQRLASDVDKKLVVMILARELNYWLLLQVTQEKKKNHN